jgi:hypothetical protein
VWRKSSTKNVGSLSSRNLLREKLQAQALADFQADEDKKIMDAINALVPPVPPWVMRITNERRED